MDLFTSMRRVVLVAAAASIAAAVVLGRGALSRNPYSTAAAPASGTNLTTSRDSLRTTIAAMRQRLSQNPGDGPAAVLLADALMRAARVDGTPAVVLEAERVIRGALSHSPTDYGVQRMLGPVLLAQHRFDEALGAGRAAQRVNPDDGWNYAVIGDALLELGQYEEAFDAFDELNARKPDPGAYARAAYARELQGDVEGAIPLMQLAAEGTGAHDPEGRAWYLCQIGHLRFLLGDIAGAEREFAHAHFVFPDHPYARSGRVRILVARWRLREAEALLASGPATPETWALRGDIARRLGSSAAAEEAYREAERLEREGWQEEEPQPAALARFLAERNRNLDEALQLALGAAETRRDINTLDTLAWAYFRKGELDRAADAIAGALRTATGDPRIRCHADAIAAARQGAVLSAEVCDPLQLLFSRAVSEANP